MGEAILSALLQVVYQNLASPIIEKFGLLWGVEEELRELSSKLLRIRATSVEVEGRIVKEETVRIWLRDAKDVAYDADDILDEMSTEVQRCYREDQMQNSDANVSKSFSSYSTNEIRHQLEIAPKIHEVLQKLNKIVREADILHLAIGPQWIDKKERKETTSLIDESCVVGRATEREQIVSMLLDELNGRINVIPIVGMGGIGKTTLAQLAYNDQRVTSHFDLLMWTHVSEEFNVSRLTKSMIEYLSLDPCHLKDLASLHNILSNKLKYKRFLLVLDDVWSENYADWESLRLPLSYGAQGSKIIVTTQSIIVSKIMGTVSPYYMKCLSDADCWSLFMQQASRSANIEQSQRFLFLGEAIAKKCKGLPLAAKTIGRLAYAKVDENEWEIMLENEIYGLQEDNNEIVSAFMFSCNNLPTHLKQCFTYCSLFPMGYAFDPHELVLLWMAQGFVNPCGRKKPEEVGTDYFDALVSKSFFQPTGVDKSTYKIHEVIHSLAKSLSLDECFTLEGDKSAIISERTRHFSVVCHTLGPRIFKCFRKCNRLRTVLLLREHFYRVRAEQVPCRKFLELRCLRVLDLSAMNIKELPESIGDLKHLRYLDLSRNLIKKLPDTITQLYVLQTLKLAHCSELLELPKDTRSLVSLRHLILDTFTSSLISMPPGIGELTNLQTLSAFVVGKETGCGIGELKSIKDLSRALDISKLENVVNEQEAKDARLNMKPHLRRLRLRWSGREASAHYENTAEEVLSGLQPHPNLEHLGVASFEGAIFPSWMGDPSFSKLVNLALSNCRNCLQLPILGQLPSLRYLHISGIYGLKLVGREFCWGTTHSSRGFPSLVTLIFLDLPNFEEWLGVNEGDFPCLQELDFLYCPKLRELPHLPSTLENLKVGGCEQLTATPSFSSLHNLELKDCDILLLASMPLLTSLSSLFICDSPKLEYLPRGLLEAATSLKELKIRNCAQLTSLPIAVEMNGLISLRRLEIWDCPQLETLPEEGLPTRLQHFEIFHCRNLMSLPRGLSTLTALRVMEIRGCGRLSSLPEEGLPPTLQNISIRDCSLLKRRCEFEVGEDWHKIAHIPNIEIDYEYITSI